MLVFKIYNPFLKNRVVSYNNKLLNFLSESWLGRQDSNLGMPVPKTGVLSHFTTPQSPWARR
tara:strand:+ start:891 stop:1076 length:186 start_codon:yes stop_codon:yes gene_type:complete